MRQDTMLLSLLKLSFSLFTNIEYYCVRSRPLAYQLVHFNSTAFFLDRSHTLVSVCLSLCVFGPSMHPFIHRDYLLDCYY